jgi:hypothetical protein
MIVSPAEAGVSRDADVSWPLATPEIPASAGMT